MLRYHANSQFQNQSNVHLFWNVRGHQEAAMTALTVHHPIGLSSPSYSHKCGTLFGFENRELFNQGKWQQKAS